MSRRKQSKPRHLEGEIESRALPIYPPELPGQRPDTDPENPLSHNDSSSINDFAGDKPSITVNGEFADPVTCVNCQVQFNTEWDLLAHEKECYPLPLGDTAHYDRLNGQEDDDAVHGPGSGQGSEDGEGEKEDQEVEEEGMYQEELMSRVRGELMGEEGAEEEGEEDMVEGGAQSDPEDYASVPLPPLAVGASREGGYPFITPDQPPTQQQLQQQEKKGEENKENNSGLSNHKEGGGQEEGGPVNGEAGANFESPMAALSGMFPGNNVTLEPMAATKAAVAQFPLAPSQDSEDEEDTGERTDSPGKALEEYKKRDMMHQQFIRTMQAAMMKAGINMTELMPDMNMYMMNAHLGFPPPPAALMGSHSMAGYLSSQAEKLQKEQRAAKEDGPKDLSKDLSKNLGKDLSLDIEKAIKQVDREFVSSSSSASSKPKQESDSAKPTSSVPLSSSFSTSSYLSSLASSSSAPVTSSSLSALSSMTNGSGLGGSSSLGDSIKQEGGRSGRDQYSSSSLSALQRETDALKSSILPQLHMPMTPEEYRGYCQRGTVLQRSQYACDDPFFKHKCRFCHKVFGSDSALQIHVRSHTGERPFKCNICGNRFSTKGNLKVHFERHKAKYPHIKMNPNPVPEHFDRLPPIVPPPMSSSTPMPPSLPLPSGMMHGEPHSPGMPRMMLPPHGGPGGFFSPTSMAPGFMPHPFARLPGPPPHHMMPGPPRGLMSPVQPKMEPLMSSSPRASPRGTPKSTGSDERRSTPPRHEADFHTPSSHGSSEKVSSSRASSPPPPSSASSAPPTSSAPRSTPGTPVSSSPLVSPPIPPLIPAHPSSMGLLPLSMSSPHPMSHTPGPIFSNHSLPATPTSFPLPSPLSSAFPGLMHRGGPHLPHPHPHPHGPHHDSPFAPRPPLPAPDEGLFRNSILPSKTIDPSENLEQYMECQKSETSKLEEMVNSISDKVREPNQCVICKRVLSCKSALQMHYRIHTGERPFKCKICNRKFTTKGNLKTHMGVHRAKPAMRVVHACPVCHKPFTNILVLQQHLRQHGANAANGPHPHLPLFPHLPGWPPKTPMPPGHLMGLPPMPHKLHEPFDLSRHHEPRELDLSNKRLSRHYGSDGEGRAYSSSFADRDDEDECSPTEEDERMNEEAMNEEGMVDEELMMGDEEGEEDLMDERDEEAYNMSRDGGSSGPASQGPQSAFSDNGDSDRPDSNVSASYGGYDGNHPLPPVSEGMDGFLNPTLPPPRGVANPSLAALEDHVKSIESTVSQSGFERFRHSMGFGASPFMMDKSLSPGLMMPHHPAGIDRSPVSPRSQGPSEAGSDGGREDAKFPMSDYPLNPLGFPLMGMDAMRGHRNNTTCPTCFKTFACRSALDIHVRSHTKERPYRCDECDKSFSTRGNLKQHQLTHKAERELAEGGESSQRASGSEQGDDSESAHEKPHQESVAASPSQSLSQPDKPQSDSQVNENSNSDSPTQNSDPKPPSSSASSTSSTSQQPAPPLPSQNSFSSPPSSSSSSSNHASPSNNPPKPTTTNNNSKSFPDSNTVKKEHTSPLPPRDVDSIARRPKHMCDTCMKPFSSASALQIHTRTHTGDKPFKCNICSKAFTTRGNLKVHMGTHMYHNSPSRRGRRMSIDSPFLFASNPYLAAAAAGFHPGPPRPPPPHDVFFQYQNLMNGMAPPRGNEIPVIQSVNGGIGHHLPPMYPGFPTHPFPPHPASEDSLKHPADLSLSRSHSDSGERERERGRDRERERERGRDVDREHSPASKRPREHSPSPPPSSTGLHNGSADLGGTITSSGELDLSMKSSTPRSSPFQKTSPKPAYPASPKAAYPMPSPPAKPSPRSSAGSPPPLASVHAKDGAQDRMLSSPKSWMWATSSCHHCGQSFPGPSALEQHIQTHHLKTDSHTSGQKAITA
ncbi:sal-like protein 3 [Littorina saxatilis]|uniref:sal-like protein 3 n=1 Tax=Littorina saxatilis TaxID=31220 RepID=UPI0038B5664B